MSADCDLASVLTRLWICGNEILASSMRDVEAQAVGAAQFGAHARRGDERLGRHAVPQHAGPADTVGVDDGDLGDVRTAAGRDQRGLVAGGPAADDHDAGNHGPNLAAGALPYCPPIASAERLRLAPVPIYAAYGSNMHPEQMLQRAPHSPMAGTGWLHGWRLTFGGEDIGWEGALATLVEDPDSKVFVVLYDMTKEDEANLDRWEGPNSASTRRFAAASTACRRTPTPIRCWRGCTSSTRGRAASRRRATSA